MTSEKTLILGDIHGRTCWKNIIEKESPDKVIFLGDYVSTHDKISAEQQVENFLDICTYKVNNPNTILLQGNHDEQFCGYYWAEMSGWDSHLYKLLSNEHFKEMLLEFSQLAYFDDNVLYSHAGISEYWLKEIAHLDKPEEVCNLKPSEILGYNYNTGYGGGYGNSISQSPIWIRPQALIQSLPDGYIQVVGHTPVSNIQNVKNLIETCKSDLYLCDNLPNQYLIKENNQFIIKTNE